MKLEIIEEAEEELFTIALWYEDQESGFGQRFRQEILQVFQVLIKDPYIWRERPEGYR